MNSAPVTSILAGEVCARRRRSASRSTFLAGARDVLPFLVGVLPFGTIVGGLAATLDLTPAQSLAFAVGLFAGMAELVVLELHGSGAPLAVVVITALVINLRLALYSASISPYLNGPQGLRRWLMAYLVTDQSYAVSLNRFLQPAPPSSRVLYFLGAAIPMWTTWQVAHLSGYVLGAHVPASWSLDFAVPLTFTAVLVPLLRDRRMRRATAVAALAFPLAQLLPLQLGLIAATFAGIIGAAWGAPDPETGKRAG